MSISVISTQEHREKDDTRVWILAWILMGRIQVMTSLQVGRVFHQEEAGSGSKVWSGQHVCKVPDAAGAAGNGQWYLSTVLAWHKCHALYSASGFSPGKEGDDAPDVVLTSQGGERCLCAPLDSGDQQASPSSNSGAHTLPSGVGNPANMMVRNKGPPIAPI
jgi:hypothetical protein